MPRTIDSAYNTHLQGAVLTTTRCLKIKRTDDEIFAFTRLDVPLDIDLGDGDGEITYQASNAARFSAIAHVAGLQPDNFSIDGILASDAINAADLRAGLFNSAEYTLFEVNYEDLTQDPLILQTGTLGEVQIRDNSFSVEMRPLTDALNQRIGELVSPICRADLGDARCKVRLVPPTWAATTAYTVRQARDAGTGSVVKPTTENGCHFKCTTAGTSGATEPTWNTVIGGTTNDGTVVWTAIKALSLTGTVSAVVDRANFTATGISIEADWWNYGVLEWLTGANAGLKAEVKDDSGAGVLKLFLAMPSLPVIGDTFLVKAGCDKRQTTCKTKFDNIWNRRAEDFVPGTDVALDYPDAS
jgi:uncharacterized phage protein (TIGR02218 family)